MVTKADNHVYEIEERKEGSAEVFRVPINERVFRMSKNRWLRKLTECEVCEKNNSVPSDRRSKTDKFVIQHSRRRIHNRAPEMRVPQFQEPSSTRVLRGCIRFDFENRWFFTFTNHKVILDDRLHAISNVRIQYFG